MTKNPCHQTDETLRQMIVADDQREACWTELRARNGRGQAAKAVLAKMAKERAECADS